MKWYNWAIYIIGIIAMIVAVFQTTQLNKFKSDYNSINYKIDSLKSILNGQQIKFEKERFNYLSKIDSLIKVKNKTITKYETKYINFSDVTITDDDTIIEYISTKIHNSK